MFAAHNPRSIRPFYSFAFACLATALLHQSTDAQRIFRPVRPLERTPVQNQDSGRNPGKNQVVTLEAEQLTASVSQGRTIRQDMRQFGNWSGGNQVLWVDQRPNQKMELQFNAKKAGRFPVTVYMTKAADFGNVSIGLGGQQLANVSGYSQNVSRAAVSLGQVNLRRGRNTLIFIVNGKERISKGYRVGIDSVQITYPRERIPVPNLPRFPDNVERVPNDNIGDTPLPGIPNDPPVVVMPERRPDVPPLNVKLKAGAKLVVPAGDFNLVAPQELGTGNYFLSLKYDVSKIPSAGAAIFQIVQTPFRTNDEGDGYPDLNPYSLLQKATLSGKSGLFRIDTRQLPRNVPQGKGKADYHIRVIPVVSQANPIIVGKASNIIEVFYNKEIPGTNDFEFVPQLDVDAFAEMLEGRIKNKASGYAVVVLPYNGTARHIVGGMARTEADGSPQAMTVHHRTNIASVTKMFAAVAMLKAIDANPDVSLSTKFSTLLPDDWVIGTNVETISLAELMTHFSGFRVDRSVGTDDAGLRKVVSDGVPDLATKNAYKYVNHNFALTRILLPQIKTINGATGNADQILRDINLSLLSPAGIQWAYGEPDAATALSHTFPAGNKRGTNWGAKKENIGSSGLHLSAAELAQFMQTLVKTDKVLDDKLRMQMTTWQIGCRTSRDRLGVGFGHGGYLRSHETATSTPDIRQEINTLAYAFSDGTVVGLIVNSSYADSPNAPPNFRPILIECFNSNLTGIQP